MAKKKDAAALFEVISKSSETRARDGLNVPTWMRTRGKFVEEPVAEQEAAVEEQAERPPVPETPVTVEPSPAEPMISTVGGRLRLSLNYVSCMVVFVAMLVLLVGAFVLGRYSAGRQGPAHTAEVGKLPAQGKREEGKKESPAKDARIPGKYYLVIQNLRGMSEQLKAEAYGIQDFCKAQDKPATVNEWRGSYIVWSVTPFDSSAGPDARQFALEMERLGKQYLAQGGNYNFMPRRRSEGRLEPMFIRYALPKP